ncbi:phosphoadenosine phosphosulfate reductase domain-containing protein [Pseudomonas sp. Marseille-Q7302]
MSVVARTAEIDALLSRDAVVAIGVSGGKDSDACALATAAYLDQVGHRGPRLLIHADLGSVEWEQSLPKCEELASEIGWELAVVRREAGGMMERWEGRWENNVRRYADLSCVKLILPWSTPSMRFCTSELKSAVIASYLKKRFPGQDIINVTGIRRQESSSRSKMPVSKVDTRLNRRGLQGLVWNSIIEWTLLEVLGEIAGHGRELHEAYTRYGMSRVSCSFCIMASKPDLIASATCASNQDTYRRMVALEARSSFSFQSGAWLGDIAPHLLDHKALERIRNAKEVCRIRESAEATIPRHLHYVSGWPACIPTAQEAELLAGVRLTVARSLKLDIACTTGSEVRARYAELYAAKPDQIVDAPVHLIHGAASQIAFEF